MVEGKPEQEGLMMEMIFPRKTISHKIISICYFLIMVRSNSFEVGCFEGIGIEAPVEKKKAVILLKAAL